MTEKLFDECDNPEWMDKLAEKLELIEYANSLRDKSGKIEGDFVWAYTAGARERIDEVVSKFKSILDNNSLPYKITYEQEKHYGTSLIVIITTPAFQTTRRTNWLLWGVFEKIANFEVVPIEGDLLRIDFEIDSIFEKSELSKKEVEELRASLRNGAEPSSDNPPSHF